MAPYHPMQTAARAWPLLGPCFAPSGGISSVICGPGWPGLVVVVPCIKGLKKKKFTLLGHNAIALTPSTNRGYRKTPACHPRRKNSVSTLSRSASTTHWASQRSPSGQSWPGTRIKLGRGTPQMATLGKPYRGSMPPAILFSSVFFALWRLLARLAFRCSQKSLTIQARGRLTHGFQTFRGILLTQVKTQSRDQLGTHLQIHQSGKAADAGTNWQQCPCVARHQNREPDRPSRAQSGSLSGLRHAGLRACKWHAAKGKGIEITN